MKTISIRGIDPELDRAIKSRAQQNNMSANEWVLQVLRKAAGTGKDLILKKYHDLDALAGGWSKDETAAFKKNTMIFERIDAGPWK